MPTPIAIALPTFQGPLRLKPFRGLVPASSSLRFDTPEQDNGNFVAAFRAPSDTESLMDVV